MERKLRDMSWKEFSDYAETSKTVIIPSGACEVYGLNLPLGSDILVAKAARLRFPPKHSAPFTMKSLRISSGWASRTSL